MNSSIKSKRKANFDQATENIKRNLELYGQMLHGQGKFKNARFTFVEERD